MRPAIPQDVLDVFPNATPERLARIKRTKPLADLSKGYATGVPDTQAPAGRMPLPDQAWSCMGPLGADGVRWICWVEASSFIAARAAAAIVLQCEPGHIEVKAE